MERLAVKGQTDEPQDADGVSRYLSSAFVLLPSDVFPLPVEEVPQPPRSLLLKVLRNAEFTDIVEVIIGTTDQAGKGGVDGS